MSEARKLDKSGLPEIPVSGARSAMQSALDSTALMLAKDLSSGTITTSQIAAKAQNYFAALYTNKDASNVSVTATYTASSSMGSTIRVSGSGSITPRSATMLLRT